MASPQPALAAAFESWNAGNLDGYLELYDDAIRLHGYSPQPMDKGEVRGFYEGIFRAFDSPKLEFHATLWDDDACAIQFTLTGQHVAESWAFRQLAPRSNSPESPCCTSAVIE